MSILKLDTCFATVIFRLLENEKPGGRRRKEYEEAFGRMKEKPIRKLNGTVMKFLNYWAWKEVKVWLDELRSRKIVLVLGMSATVAKK